MSDVSQTLRGQIAEWLDLQRNSSPPFLLHPYVPRKVYAAIQEAADRLASLEQQDGIQDCEDHWFLQGGQAEFGEIRGEQNADDFISSVLGLVRSKRFALARSIGLGRGNTWEEIEAQVASLEQAQQALREELEVLRSTVPVTTADRNAKEGAKSL